MSTMSVVPKRTQNTSYYLSLYPLWVSFITFSSNRHSTALRWGHSSQEISWLALRKIKATVNAEHMSKTIHDVMHKLNTSNQRAMKCSKQ